MSERDGSRDTVSWITAGTDLALRRASELEVRHDPESNEITFVSQAPVDSDTTTAWLTADAALVVDVTEMR
jgi:hypothetical protein